LFQTSLGVEKSLKIIDLEFFNHFDFGNIPLLSILHFPLNNYLCD
jgi:hypothetical protein